MRLPIVDRAGLVQLQHHAVLQLRIDVEGVPLGGVVRGVVVEVRGLEPPDRVVPCVEDVGGDVAGAGRAGHVAVRVAEDFVDVDAAPSVGPVASAEGVFRAARGVHVPGRDRRQEEVSDRTREEAARAEAARWVTREETRRERRERNERRRRSMPFVDCMVACGRWWLVVVCGGELLMWM